MIVDESLEHIILNFGVTVKTFRRKLQKKVSIYMNLTKISIKLFEYSHAHVENGKAVVKTFSEETPGHISICERRNFGIAFSLRPS